MLTLHSTGFCAIKEKCEEVCHDDVETRRHRRKDKIDQTQSSIDPSDATKAKFERHNRILQHVTEAISKNKSAGNRKKPISNRQRRLCDQISAAFAEDKQNKLDMLKSFSRPSVTMEKTQSQTEHGELPQCGTLPHAPQSWFLEHARQRIAGLSTTSENVSDLNITLHVHGTGLNERKREDTTSEGSPHPRKAHHRTSHSSLHTSRHTDLAPLRTLRSTHHEPSCIKGVRPAIETAEDRCDYLQRATPTSAVRGPATNVRSIYGGRTGPTRIIRKRITSHSSRLPKEAL